MATTAAKNLPKMHSGIRIYNFFPLLARDFTAIASHFPRIAAMGFDWVFLNPFHQTGGSRSLYAVADYMTIDPRLASGADLSLTGNLPALTGPARAAGLGIMMDLVINHTSDNHPFIVEKSHWYAHDPEGNIVHPFAIDPDDNSKVTVWGDLSELDFAGTGSGEITAYFSDYVKNLIRLGVRGFRCDAAYKVPASVWATIIKAARKVDKTVVFAAETLGCSLNQIEAFDGVGFDYLFNSSKWWDLRGHWAVEQYNQFRHIAPSIAFPESHDTSRLAADVGQFDPDMRARYARLRYAVSACFSTGIMMPVGYEFGFEKPLQVVETTPADWEEGHYDISADIAALNEMKAALPVLNIESEMEYRVVQDAVTFAKFTEGRMDAAILVTNPAPDREVWIDRETLSEWAGIPADDLHEVTPGRESEPEAGRISIEPLGYRIFATVRDKTDTRRTTAKNTRPVPHAAWKAESRVAIEAVQPSVDGGRFPVKRIVGDRVIVSADILADGHEILGAHIVYRHGKTEGHAKLRPYDNDRWTGDFTLTEIGRTYFTIEAWVDEFESWRRDTTRKIAADQDVGLELIEGLHLLEHAARATKGTARTLLMEAIEIHGHASDDAGRSAVLMSPEIRALMANFGPRGNLTRLEQEFEIVVDREQAVYASWYEMFPRSQGTDPTRSATFDECIARLPEIAELGFDVVYLVPIHPIGLTFRKGRNNSVTAQPGEPGSPYAIGGPMGDGTFGGHEAVHPGLGTLEDFRRFVTAAKALDMEIALDFAIQCSMDHPWLKQHPEWFYFRPDGSIKYAENPPKKYQDIVNLNFYGPHRQALWNALRDVVLFWVAQGVEIFRVDNPHTKAFPFWEWMIREVQAKNPRVLFLAEAFTRPKLMKELAKIGFSQSYTYFTWRNTRAELTEYLTELTTTEVREYFRPNFFPTTPDILPPCLHFAKPAAFKSRLALAATLSATYGMYNGYELCEGTPVPGKEEYLDSEKYQFKVRDWDRPGNIKEFVRRLNEARRTLPQLQSTLGVHFHHVWSEQFILYAKYRPPFAGVVFVAVLLDPDAAIDYWLELPLADYGFTPDRKIHRIDVLNGETDYSGAQAFQLRLTPEDPVRIMLIR